MKSRPAPDPCPNCDEEVPRDARSCPNCGADWNTGWNTEDATSDALDLPEEDFDYDAFVAREFGGGRKKDPAGPKTWVMVTAGVLAALLLLGWVILR